MHNLGFALDGAWHVLLAGLLLGAGLPVLFALGVRSLAWADAGGPARPLGRLAGFALFAVVIILTHCYYGYRASGGPAGVGLAVGRAVRFSIVAMFESGICRPSTVDTNTCPSASGPIWNRGATSSTTRYWFACV